ncbi:MAG: hypothetical protein AB7K09_08615 [Planctomycetota bacterium]
MQLDPLIIVAQVINFLVLVWLLDRFLFKPVARVMDERAARVQAGLDDARRARADADRLVAEVQERLDGIAIERERVLAQAHADADGLKASLVRDVRSQVEQMRTHWCDGVQREREGFLERLQERVLDHTHRAMQRALADLADDNLEQRVVRGFLDRLDRLDEHEWQELIDVAMHVPHRHRKKKQARSRQEGAGTQRSRRPGFDVVSAHDLPADVRERIESAVRHHAADATLHFRLDPGLGCGIELRGPGRKLAWSLADYLATLRVAVQEVFEQLTRRASA